MSAIYEKDDGLVGVLLDSAMRQYHQMWFDFINEKAAMAA